MSDPQQPQNPQHPGPYGQYPPQPMHTKPKGGCFRWLGIATAVVVGLVILISIIAIAGSGGDDDDTSSDTTEQTDDGPQTNSGNTENPPTEDVELTECGPGVGNPGGGNFVGAAGTITNHSSEPSDYTITVEFTEGGTRYAESFAAATAIGPNQQAEWSAVTVDDARPGTECSITSVERFAS